MARSGSIDLTLNRDEIITEALEILGVLGEGESPTSAALTSSARSLNMLVKGWQAEGLQLHALQRYFLFPKKGQSEYLLGGSTDHVATTFFETTLSTASAASDTTITVVSDSGISDGYFIGVQVEDNVVHWSEVTGAPSSSVVTITSGLPSIAAEDNLVYVYATKANRPMKLLEGMVSAKDGTNDKTDTPLNQIYRNDWLYLGNKESDGRPNQFWYDRQLDTGVLRLWPQADREQDYLTFWGQRTLDDFDSATDDAPFPQEYFLALAWGLAELIAPKYGVGGGMWDRIKANAREFKMQVYSYDTEDEFRLIPGERWMQR